MLSQYKGESMFLIKKNSILLVCVFTIAVSFSGCSTLNHNVGMGAPNGNEVASDRQWYILWGLVPLNNADGGQMAKNKGLTNNYTIQSQATFLDCIINFFTSIVSVSGQTVKVLANSNGGISGGFPQAGGSSSANSLAQGNQAMGNKDYNGALQYYQAAVAADPNSASAYQGLGTCYYYLGQKPQALNAFKKALELNPSNTQLSAFVQSMK